jgi:hypothetical protein
VAECPRSLTRTGARKVSARTALTSLAVVARSDAVRRAAVALHERRPADRSRHAQLGQLEARDAHARGALSPGRSPAFRQLVAIGLRRRERPSRRLLQPRRCRQHGRSSRRRRHGRDCAGRRWWHHRRRRWHDGWKRHAFRCGGSAPGHGRVDPPWRRHRYHRARRGERRERWAERTGRRRPRRRRQQRC